MTAPVTTAIASPHVIIGVGDMAVSDNVQAVLSTYALGSCIGLALLDRGSRVAGLAHIVLPEAGERAEAVGKYADLAVPDQLAAFGVHPDPHGSEFATMVLPVEAKVEKAQTRLYDLIAWAPLGSPPGLSFAPASMAIAP